MQRSIFGVFTAALCIICILCALVALQKNRRGLVIIFLLNAFTNLVNSIHAFHGTLF